MDNLVDFFSALTERNTWIRFFYVALGTLLVYFALVRDTGRMNLWFGKAR
jgi:hypothetical protein